MARSPLSAVPPSPSSPPPPPSLGPAGRALWTSILADFSIEDSAGLAMLEQAAAAADRAAMLAEVIERDGAVVEGKSNSAFKDELAARSFIVRTLQRLGCNLEATRSTLGRPAKWRPGA